MIPIFSCTAQTYLKGVLCVELIYGRDNGKASQGYDNSDVVKREICQNETIICRVFKTFSSLNQKTCYFGYIVIAHRKRILTVNKEPQKLKLP